MIAFGRYLLFFLFISSATSIQAIDWPGNFCAYGLGMPHQTVIWKRFDKLTAMREVDERFFYQDLSLEDLKLKADGFYELDVFKSKWVVLFGARYFFFHDLTQPDYGMFDIDFHYDDFYKKNEFQFKQTNEDMLGHRTKSISSIKVPDILEESGPGGKIRFDTYDMERYYARTLDGGVVANPKGKPWATSKDPIDMTIEITFNKTLGLENGGLFEGSNYLIILNGYANPLKRHLYKENRRIKTLRIEPLDNKPSFSITQDLEDVVRFHVIRFPRSTKTIRLTILDYYEGSKYKDLCVQAFLTDFDLWTDSCEDLLNGAVRRK